MASTVPVDIKERAILIRLTRRRDRGWRRPEDLTPDELYAATRRAWIVGPRRDQADYAFAVSKWIVLEVYRIEGPWTEVTQGRLCRPAVR